MAIQVNQQQQKPQKVRATRAFHIVRQTTDAEGAAWIDRTITEPGKVYTVDAPFAREMVFYNKAVLVDSPEDKQFMAAFAPEKPAKQSA